MTAPTTLPPLNFSPSSTALGGTTGDQLFKNEFFVGAPVKNGFAIDRNTLLILGVVGLAALWIMTR